MLVRKEVGSAARLEGAPIAAEVRIGRCLDCDCGRVVMWMLDASGATLGMVRMSAEDAAQLGMSLIGGDRSRMA